MFSALFANLANIVAVLVSYILGSSFFTTVTIEKRFENNTLKSLWKSRVENNGGRRAGVLAVALWDAQRLFQVTAEEKNGSF